MNVLSETTCRRTLVMENPDELRTRNNPAKVAFENYARPVRDAPDAHCLALDGEGRVGARCSLWWRETPRMDGGRLGYIGHYAAADDDAAARLIQRVESELKMRGCRTAVAPIDGNTWRQYRFVTEGETEAAFWSEPTNPPAWPAQFRAAGFSPAAHYISALNDNLEYEDPAVLRAADRFWAAGVRIRSLDSTRMEAELQRIFEITSVSFQENLFYSPVSRGQFHRQYQPLLPHIRKELVLFAEHQGRCVGYVFMIPDLAQAPSGRALDTAILKTVAVLPGRARLGLGAVLVAQSQIVARSLGFRRVIHALMHESNASLNISQRFAHPMRRYAVFSKGL